MAKLDRELTTIDDITRDRIDGSGRDGDGNIPGAGTGNTGTTGDAETEPISPQEEPATDNNEEEFPDDPTQKYPDFPPQIDTRTERFVRFNPPISTIVRDYVKNSLAPITPQRLSITNIREFPVRVDFGSDDGIIFTPSVLNINPNAQEVVSISFDSAIINNLSEGVNEGTILITISPPGSTQ